ncbi:MAG: radical SAM family heme chaperone HemW [Acidaminococcus fermentans]|uniref:radical SAM family heme chaperone HemW n=1 Tax=Acidaminococcus fermentans TaxID=905 RepID=UPI00242CA043|nr:radical SAM family heme chaperone HemW [Acidaminococcus fermentans]MCI6286118.1 radical SAM family heme chaperone HemW [Acidaminococcus fermentans]MDD7194875.1 radical SAM family heme chaperone HemW [Acidaminococcus fermentans]MDY2853015.1 radical SAM family heme chaperone HemW [Acidaminococcus fermentans]
MSHPWESYQALYVHIPFCVHKCAYCDFASYQIYNDHIMTDYARRLVEEISAWTPALPVSPTATVYFGGGTPSVLPLEDLAAIVTALKERGFWQHPAEATLEANPGTVDRERLRFYRQLGFDRLSLGIQSFQPGELAAMGRIHTAEQAEEAIALAREAGFRRISGDLIYGYPGQTVETVRDSLERLLDTGVDHVSVYGLTVEEGTLLAKQVREGKALLPSEDASGTMYDFLMEALPQAGYHRYEISNFARPGQESRHNQVYWHYDPYMAFGAAACRFDGKIRETNPRNLQAYLQGAPPEREILTCEDRRAELVFMNLRTVKGLSLEEFTQRTGEDFFHIYEEGFTYCRKQGWITREGNRIRLTEQGMRYGNLAFEEFL